MNSNPLDTGNEIQIKEYNTRPLLFLKFVVQKMVISHIHVHVYLFDTVQYISVYHFCLHHLDQIRYICSIHVIK
jgi:hypothetical protein